MLKPISRPADVSRPSDSEIIDVIELFRDRIQEEWVSYEYPPELIPLVLSYRWLNENTSISKPLTGSLYRPIVRVILEQGLSMEVNGHFLVDGYLSSADLNDMSVYNSDMDEVGTVTINGISANTNGFCPDCDKGRCFNLLYKYTSCIFPVLRIYGYRMEPYIEIIKFSHQYNVPFHTLTPKVARAARLKFNNVVNYAGKHGIASAGYLVAKGIDDNVKSLIAHVYDNYSQDDMRISQMKYNVIYILYCSCMKIVLAHRGQLEAGQYYVNYIDHATAPFSESLYIRLFRDARWAALEKMLSISHPKEITAKLYRILHPDVPEGVCRYIKWRNEPVVKCGYEPFIRSPLRHSTPSLHYPNCT